MSAASASRRGLLGAAGAIAAAFAVPAVAKAFSPVSVGPDAALLLMLAEFDAEEVAMQAIYDGPYRTGELDENTVDAFIAPHHARQAALIAPILAARATTPAAIVARARTVARWAPDLAEDGKEYWCEAMVAALLRDALELGI